MRSHLTRKRRDTNELLSSHLGDGLGAAYLRSTLEAFPSIVACLREISKKERGRERYNNCADIMEEVNEI